MSKVFGTSIMAAGVYVLLGAALGWAGGFPPGNDNSGGIGDTGGGTNALSSTVPPPHVMTPPTDFRRCS